MVEGLVVGQLPLLLSSAMLSSKNRALRVLCLFIAVSILLVDRIILFGRPITNTTFVIFTH